MYLLFRFIEAMSTLNTYICIYIYICDYDAFFKYAYTYHQAFLSFDDRQTSVDFRLVELGLLLHGLTLQQHVVLDLQIIHLLLHGSHSASQRRHFAGRLRLEPDRKHTHTTERERLFMVNFRADMRKPDTLIVGYII